MSQPVSHVRSVSINVLLVKAKMVTVVYDTMLMVEFLVLTRTGHTSAGITILCQQTVLLTGYVSAHVIMVRLILLFSIRDALSTVYSARTGTTVTIEPRTRQKNWHGQRPRQLVVSVFSVVTRHHSHCIIARWRGSFLHDAEKRGFAGKQMVLPPHEL